MGLSHESIQLSRKVASRQFFMQKRYKKAGKWEENQPENKVRRCRYYSGLCSIV